MVCPCVCTAVRPKAMRKGIVWGALRALVWHKGWKPCFSHPAAESFHLAGGRAKTQVLRFRVYSPATQRHAAVFGKVCHAYPSTLQLVVPNGFHAGKRQFFKPHMAGKATDNFPVGPCVVCALKRFLAYKKLRAETAFMGNNTFPRQVSGRGRITSA